LAQGSSLACWVKPPRNFCDPTAWGLLAPRAGIGMGCSGSKTKVQASSTTSKVSEGETANSASPQKEAAPASPGNVKVAKDQKLQPLGDPQLQLSGGDIRDKYEILAVLGSGSFGEVREVRVKAFPDKLRAVKITERQENDGSEKAQKKSDSLSMFRREVDLLRSLKHPNIVRVWDVYETAHYFYVVMDLCRGGELFDMINELDRLPESDTAVIAKQLLGGIDYMHSKSVMHRDIKAENVLLTEWSATAVVKIIDFGIASKFQRGEMFDKISGSPQYMAPELVGQRYDYRVDMWAFGILMYFTLYGRYPFDGNNVREILLTVLHGTIDWESDVHIDPKTVSLLKGCLQRKPRKRTTAKAALGHPWIVQAKRPDAEKHREPTEVNITPEMLKEGGRSKETPVAPGKEAKGDAGSSAKRTNRLQQETPSAKDLEPPGGETDPPTSGSGHQVEMMLDPNQALEFQDMYFDWKRQTSTDSTASSASQMGVYPGGAFQEEEEDADVKRMKAELGGDSEDALSPAAVGLPAVAPLRIGEGRSSGQQLSRVVPSSGPMPSPVASAVLIPGTMEPA